MFQRKILPGNCNLFAELSDSCSFERVGSRQVAMLAEKTDQGIPLVRSTLKMQQPTQYFRAAHVNLISAIKKLFNEIEGLEFNNAMVELYTNSYRDMKYHTDQSQDLKQNSYICLVSCYNNKHENLRELKIKPKNGGLVSTVVLNNNSVVIFDTKDNYLNSHKICLPSPDIFDTCWLGITFRCSKTFIKFEQSIPRMLPDGEVLRLATRSEEIDTFRIKARENLVALEIDYPENNFTLSSGDLIELAPLPEYKCQLISFFFFFL